MDQERTDLNNQLAGLQEQIRTLNGQVAALTREKDEALRREAKWESILVDHNKTVERNTQLQLDAQKAQVALEAERTKLTGQLEDVTKALEQKMAIVMQLEAKLKGLTEEKVSLQNKLDEFLKQYGKVTAKAAPVTVLREVVRELPPVAEDIDLKGSLTEVDLKNNIATLSIGSAAGVKPNMRFHVTRGSKFICDFVVLDVEPDESVGWLELVQAGPQDKPSTGDGVSTN
jgi:DNA repair exonuclease SbcCD ATPase subunit